MPPGPSDRASRARPVADAPVAALIDASEDLAKAWLLELVASGPLSAAPSLPLESLATEGPALCAAVARALGDDVELARLRPGGDLAALGARAGALGAARDAGATVAAVEALRRVVWDAALAEVPRAPAALVADLADRLAAVCATVVNASLAEPAGEAPPAAEPADEPAFASSGDVRAADLRAPIVRPPRAGEDVLDSNGAVPRVADGDPQTHLAARAAEFVSEGRPFAVLLVELDGVESLLAAERDDEVHRAVEAAERALEDLARPGDAIRREAPGRLWLTLPGAGPAGARALALRAAAAVERAAQHRGRPLTASVGVAVCPRDGAEAQALADHAEEDLLSARAAGTHGASPPSR
jgi:GGDEF domain-containing protein